ncbi:hypothetical protein Mapa_012192 [Marchantia paleacea]|nr:hypothetical protein Mapa_012192 [Marchantia paleacea]
MSFFVVAPGSMMGKLHLLVLGLFWASTINARELMNDVYNFGLADGPSPGDGWLNRRPVDVGVLLYECTRPGVWALTFDDGPSIDTTPMVLDALKENGIHATFFVIGSNLLKNGESMNTTLRAFNEGHLIASHSFTHPDFTTLSKSKMLVELRKTSNAIHHVTGKRPRYFRPPYGSTNNDVLQVLKEEEYKTVYWNLDPRDWESRNATKIFSFFEETLESSDPAADNFLSLNHDIVPATAEVIADLITIIRAKGYKFVRIDDCFNDSESPYW